MNSGTEPIGGKTTVVIEHIAHHMDEEDQGLVPKVRAALIRKQLQDIGPAWPRV